MFIPIWGNSMFLVGTRLIAVVAVATLLASCATKGLLEGADPFQITKVEVSRPAPKPATANLAEDLRYKTQNEAYRFSETGAKKILKVKIERLHIKNPIAAWLVGDSNNMAASAQVIDAATGRSEGTFNANVVDSGALQGIGGAVLAAIDNPVDVEQRLATQLAKRLLEQVYGSAYAGTVKNRVASRKSSPRYPKSYAQLKRDRECELKRNLKKQQKNKQADRGQRDIVIPAYCTA